MAEGVCEHSKAFLGTFFTFHFKNHNFPFPWRDISLIQSNTPQLYLKDFFGSKENKRKQVKEVRKLRAESEEKEDKGREAGWAQNCLRWSHWDETRGDGQTHRLSGQGRKWQRRDKFCIWDARKCHLFGTLDHSNHIMLGNEVGTRCAG